MHFVYADAGRYLTASHSYAKYVLDFSGWLKLTVRANIICDLRPVSEMEWRNFALKRCVYGFLINLCWLLIEIRIRFDKKIWVFFLSSNGLSCSTFISWFYEIIYIQIAHRLEVSMAEFVLD